MKRTKGLLAIEYAVLIAVVIAALLAMQGYTRRAICGRWRNAADTFGFGRQYEPGKTTLRLTGLAVKPEPVEQDKIYAAFKIIEIEGLSPSVQIGVEIPCNAERLDIVIWHLSDDGQSATKVKELTRECDRGAGPYFILWDGNVEDTNGNSYSAADGVYIFEAKFTYEGTPYSKSQRKEKQGLFWNDWTGN